MTANRLVLVLNIKLAFAQTNPIVGDLQHNLAQIKSHIQAAADSGVDLLIFGELALSGYPMGDYSYRPDLVDRSETALEDLIEYSKLHPNLAVVLGHVSRALTPALDKQSSAAIAHNSASVFSNGSLIGRYDKNLLPNYDVFDDWRNFIPGHSELIFGFRGKNIAVLICEDIWGDKERGKQLRDLGVDLIVVPNGSPFTHHKPAERRAAAKAFGAGMYVAYANLSGGQDELVFDGDSFLVDPSGNEVYSAGMSPGLYEVTPGELFQVSDQERLYQVLVTGLRDYLLKTGQTSVILGLSGGIDSALCAAIASDAIGPENVFGVGLPSRYSSEHSLQDAKQLAENLGIHYQVVEIDSPHRVFESLLPLSDLAKENLQARIRAVILMAISNTQGQLLVTTGNKSELAVGYSTIYGDSAGGFAPIKDLFKTDVWALSRYVNQRAGLELIPISSIEKPPSAELRPGQLDQDSLPDYQVLDQVLRLLVEQGATVAEVVAAGFERELVVEIQGMLFRAEWKRSQGAIGTKVSKVSFGRGRRVPITTRFSN